MNYSYYGVNSSSVITNEELVRLNYDGSIRVYMTGEIPIHKEIGIVQIIVDSPTYDDVNSVVSEAKKEARKMGADCLILHRYETLQRISNDELLMDSDQRNVVVESPKYVFVAGLINQ